jgi:hypothetical protein
MNGHGKSDGLVVPGKPPNNAGTDRAAEVVEGRGPAKGNSAQGNALRTQSRAGAPSTLDRVREVARRDKKVRFTALLHHVDVERLRKAYFSLKRHAAAGVDGVTWQQYGGNLEGNLQDLHDRVQRGAYRAKPSRRAYIPKADGRQRPLGIAALEDKIVQRTVVEVLNAIYETDFLGFSYGFRPGRNQHHALDALTVALEQRKVSWVLDADIRDFLEPSSRMAGEVRRAPDCGQTGRAAGPEMAGRRGDGGRAVDGVRGGDAAGGDGVARAGEPVLAPCPRPVGPALEKAAGTR